jgi:hypothetical protein
MTTSTAELRACIAQLDPGQTFALQTDGWTGENGTYDYCTVLKHESGHRGHILSFDRRSQPHHEHDTGWNLYDTLTDVVLYRRTREGYSDAELSEGVFVKRHGNIERVIDIEPDPFVDGSFTVSFTSNHTLQFQCGECGQTFTYADIDMDGQFRPSEHVQSDEDDNIVTPCCRTTDWSTLLG